MSLAENIYFMGMGIVLFILLLLVWLVFGMRRMVKWIVTVVLIAGFIGYFLYFQFDQVREHDRRLEVLQGYLAENYPGDTFVIEPEVFEKGHLVGDFQVRHEELEHIGVTLFVKETGEVVQTSTWEIAEWTGQDDLWKDLRHYFDDEYTLGDSLPEVEFLDSFIDGELTVFAVIFNGQPMLAEFEYSDYAYAFIQSAGGASFAELELVTDEYIFTYDEAAGGLVAEEE